MSKIKPSPSIALTLLALTALALIFTQYVDCGQYHPNPYVSPCQNSLGSELFPNPMAELAQSHGTALMLGANVLFIAAMWLIPWFRQRSWMRTLVSVAAYAFVSATFGFLMVYIKLS